MSAEQDSRRLTVVLNDPSAQWSEIRSAMKAKAQQGGRACTNHALVKSISSSYGDSDKNLIGSMHTAGQLDSQAAKDTADDRSGDGEDVLTALDKKIDRRASLSSQKGSRRNSSQRSSRRGFRRRRSSAKKRDSVVSFSSSNSSGRSIRSGLRFSNSSFNVSTNSISSVNIMDFGVSQRAVNAALDESARTCASLDDDVLEELQEEFDVNIERSRGAVGVNSKKDLLLSWRNNDSSLRLLDNGGLDESTRSEGDLEFIIDCDGFIGWPSMADVKDGIIEENSNEAEKETQEPKWNIEDYAYEDIDNSGTSRGLRQSLTKKFQMFTRRGSNASSASQESSGDLLKIKQTLLNAKNKEQKKMGDNSETNRRVGKSLLRLFNRSTSSASEVRSSLRSSTSGAIETSRHEPIWVRGGDSDSDDGDHYKDMYAPALTNTPKPKNRRIFKKGESM